MENNTQDDRKVSLGTTTTSEEEDEAQSQKVRKRPVTIHRRTNDRIRQDSLSHHRHFVPEPTASTTYNNNNMMIGTSSQSVGSTNENDGSTTNNSKTKSHKWVEKHTTSMCEKYKNKSCDEWTQTLLPMYKWLKVYQWKTTLMQDIVSGLTVGVMVVPQSMSYAKLAGLPVEYGLYSALVPVYAYSMFGSSRQLAVGPVALISLLLATGLSLVLDNQNITPENTDNYMEIYTTLAVQTSFLVGVTYILMGLLRLGFVTIFLSHAVISGFTTGAAVIIGMSQLKYFLGYEVLKSDRFHILIQRIIADIDQFNYKTFLLGSFSTLALVGLKHLGKTRPRFKWARALGPLTVTVVGIILQLTVDLEDKGIPILGKIPKGLPDVTVNILTPIGDFSQLFVVVISIVVVGFMESIAIAKQLASKHNYEIDSSSELIGLGMANLGAGMFQGYPVTGSFSRSAVNNESGAQSGISGFVTATLVGLVLLFLTPVFENLPLAVLASIVISGIIGLVDYPEAIYLWRVHRFDFGVWAVACVGTLFLGVEIGLAIAVGVSLLLVTYESAYPHTAVLGRLPGTTVYRNVKQYPEAEVYDGVIMVRIDAPIYFANTQNVREKIKKYEERAEEEYAARNGCVKYIILELSPVSHVDTSALHILHDMNKTYRDRKIQLCFTNPSRVVMERMVLSGLVEEVGREHFFVSLHDAMHFCLEEMDTEAISTHEDVELLESVVIVPEDVEAEAQAHLNAEASSPPEVDAGTEIEVEVDIDIDIESSVPASGVGKSAGSESNQSR